MHTSVAPHQHRGYNRRARPGHGPASAGAQHARPSPCSTLADIPTDGASGPLRPYLADRTCAAA
jgi:hypothetical protein